MSFLNYIFCFLVYAACLVIFIGMTVASCPSGEVGVCFLRRFCSLLLVSLINIAQKLVKKYTPMIVVLKTFDLGRLKTMKQD